jgi:hypothetical protein
MAAGRESDPTDPAAPVARGTADASGGRMRCDRRHSFASMRQYAPHDATRAGG